MKGLNKMLFVVFFAIGIVTGWTTITNNTVLASPSTLPTVYLERPSMPLSINQPTKQDQVAIDIDLASQTATVQGNAKNVNVNVTTAVKTVTKYKYKTIKESEYFLVYIQDIQDIVPPESSNVCCLDTINNLTYVVGK